MVARVTGYPDDGSDGRLGLTPAALMFLAVTGKVHECSGEPARQGGIFRIGRRGQHGAHAGTLGSPTFFRPGPKRGQGARQRCRDQVAKVLRALAVEADDRWSSTTGPRFAVFLLGAL